MTVETIARRIALLEIANAQNDALAESIEQLLEYIDRVGGFMNAADQQTRRHAMALLEERVR